MTIILRILHRPTGSCDSDFFVGNTDKHFFDIVSSVFTGYCEFDNPSQKTLKNTNKYPSKSYFGFRVVAKFVKLG
jgi:hypothetical protein